MNARENQVKTWVTITVDGSGMPIAHHLKQEGHRVVVGQVQDKSELQKGDKEDPKDKKNRLAQFDGILDKYPADKLVKALKKVKNKQDYYIYCDRNNVWPYAQELLEAGFTNGTFPTEEDFEMEKEREEAMEFVEEYYPDVQIIPYQKVSSVEEARQIVEEAETPLVIQSEGDYVFTVVGPDDVEQSKQVILSTLDKHEKEYAKGEIIIKEKLVAPIEITPQIVFYNGEPVYTSIDIETKNVGDGENNGNQVGCGTNLIIQTEFNDPINEIAFPPKVYELAKAHTGLFIWDISLYFTDSGIYFGEFCSNRFGYDALMTEMTMAHGPSEYFTKIMNLENPIEHFKFGTAIRAFNLKVKEEQEIIWENWKPIWLYDGKMKDDKIITIGEDWDLAVITGRGQTIEEAVDNVYDNYEGLIFKEKYARSKSDFLEDYPTSIIRRYRGTVGTYFAGPDFKTDEDRNKEKVDDFKEKVKSKLYGFLER
jgi:hypothetical protein